MSVIGVRLDRLSRLFLLVTWCVVASASSLFAQVGAGEITGLVKDQGVAAVPGATITVTSVETNRQARRRHDRRKASTPRQPRPPAVTASTSSCRGSSR